MSDSPAAKPSVLFVCVHNAGRSQMAAAWLAHLAGDRIEVRSAGSAPAGTVNPAAVAAMAEAGIDISAEVPKILTADAVRASDVVITMGCGDTCPVFPGKRYLDWVARPRCRRFSSRASRSSRMDVPGSSGSGGSAA
ncbi:hypothetical protein AB0N19_18635, partial [Streptomyces sp. NPDC051132]|uniref:arsenate reductase/protein-tyrosine-phosphatase family protein n=1 Tax=Streptomyces sp. NPDC051132 TaxID=3155667 RepID=UPI00342AFFBE